MCEGDGSEMGQPSPIIIKIGPMAPDQLQDSKSSEEVTQLSESMQINHEVMNTYRASLVAIGKKERENRFRSIRPIRRTSGRRVKKERFWWSIPAGFGILSGLIVGFSLLLLFKSVTFQEELRTQSVAAIAQNETTELQIPGFHVWAYQVGSLKDETAGKQEKDRIQAHGIQSVLRGTSPVQLFAGISSSKDSNGPFIQLLGQKGIDVYLKNYTFAENTLSIKGITKEESETLKSILVNLLHSASAELSFVGQPESYKDPGLPSKQSIKNASDSLHQAGYTNAAITLSQLAGQLSEVNLLLQGGKGSDSSLEQIEINLAGFYTNYEKLMTQLTS